MNRKEFFVPWGYDMHVHLRMDELLKAVAWFTARSFYGGLVMPNTIKKILTAKDAVEYRSQILRLCPSFNALMTIYLTAKTTPQMIREAKKTGIVWAGKWYPVGVTTGSEEGFEDFWEISSTLEEMEKSSMVLSIHGQRPGKNIDSFDREEKFLPILRQIHKTFPKLKIVMEHLSTKVAVDTVLKLGDNVAATITPQHMVLTRNDFMDGALYPDNFCIPPPQRAEDRDALIQAAISGNPNLFLGTDTAPHFFPKLKGGVFSAPTGKQVVVQVFENCEARDKIADFIAVFGPRFYGLPQGPEQTRMRMIKKDWIVPKQYNGVVPLMAGETLHYQIAD